MGRQGGGGNGTTAIDPNCRLSPTPWPGLLQSPDQLCPLLRKRRLRRRQLRLLLPLQLRL